MSEILCLWVIIYKKLSHKIDWAGIYMQTVHIDLDEKSVVARPAHLTCEWSISYKSNRSWYPGRCPQNPRYCHSLLWQTSTNHTLFKNISVRPSQGSIVSVCKAHMHLIHTHLISSLRNLFWKVLCSHVEHDRFSWTTGHGIYSAGKAQLRFWTRV